MINENVEKRAVHFDFPSLALRLKNCGLRSGAAQAALMEIVSLRRFVGVARAPLRRGARLEAIGPIGSRPALPQMLQHQNAGVGLI